MFRFRPADGKKSSLTPLTWRAFSSSGVPVPSPVTETRNEPNPSRFTGCPGVRRTVGARLINGRIGLYSKARNGLY
jgi:hypothetical protein